VLTQSVTKPLTSQGEETNTEQVARQALTEVATAREVFSREIERKRSLLSKSKATTALTMSL